MTNLKWVGSYETLKFNTTDGDLDLGQYAKAPFGGFYVRRHPKNNYQFLHVKEFNPDIDIEEVQIVQGEMMFYDKFLIPPDNRLLREPSTEKKYRDLAKKNPINPAKNLTDQEAQKVREEDYIYKDIPIGDNFAERKLIKGGII